MESINNIIQGIQIFEAVRLYDLAKEVASKAGYTGNHASSRPDYHAFSDHDFVRFYNSMADGKPSKIFCGWHEFDSRDNHQGDVDYPGCIRAVPIEGVFQDFHTFLLHTSHVDGRTAEMLPNDCEWPELKEVEEYYIIKIPKA